MENILEQLTYEDLDILIEATDAWVSRKFAGEIMSDLFTTIMVKDDETRKKMQEERKAKEIALKEQKEREKEIAVLLKAKLINFKREKQRKEVNL